MENDYVVFLLLQGMQYLHNSPLVSFGRLKSANCVVDSRWTCKVTDYGMGLFKSGAEEEESAYKQWSGVYHELYHYEL